MRVHFEIFNAVKFHIYGDRMIHRRPHYVFIVYVVIRFLGLQKNSCAERQKRSVQLFSLNEEF